MKFKGSLFGRRSNSEKRKSKEETPESDLPVVSSAQDPKLESDAVALASDTDEGHQQKRRSKAKVKTKAVFQVDEVSSSPTPNKSAASSQRKLSKTKTIKSDEGESGSEAFSHSQSMSMRGGYDSQVNTSAAQSKEVSPQGKKRNQNGGGTSDEPEQTEEIDWAKRMFLTSTERIFPGISKSTLTRKTGQNVCFCATPVRASLVLGLLLLGSYYFHFLWVIGWLFMIGRRMSKLKKVHGGLILGCSFIYVLITFLRISAGIKGNSTDDAQQLGIYWMMSTLVQLPIIIFFLLTDLFSSHFFPLTTVLDIISVIYLVAELIVGFVHLNSIISSELKDLRLAQESWKLSARKYAAPPRQNIPPYPEQEFGQGDLGSSGESSEFETNSAQESTEEELSEIPVKQKI